MPELTGGHAVADPLDDGQTLALVRLAQVLLPGDATAPGAGAVDDLRGWIRRAVVALGPEAAGLPAALQTAPATMDWDTVKLWAEHRSEEFELAAMVVSSAYFMAPEALAAIGYPQGDRKAPRNDLVVDELEGGLLDAVMTREPMYRRVTT